MDKRLLRRDAKPVSYTHLDVYKRQIQTGRIADLVLLEANPLEDIANTRKIAGVVADGHYLSREDLEQLRTRLRQLAATR